MIAYLFLLACGTTFASAVAALIAANSPMPRDKPWVGRCLWLGTASTLVVAAILLFTK